MFQESSGGTGPGCGIRREQHTIRVAPLSNGSPLTVSVLIMQGTRLRPRVGISAAIHGDEVVGVQVLRELWNSLDPNVLTGSLWLMPVANPLAFEALSRNTPLDMLDLNRVFPGTTDGWLSEQLASAISEQFLNQLDYYIDIHAGGTFPLVDYCYVLNDEGLSRAFLSDLLYKPAQLFPGTTASVTVSRNVPSTVVELGGGYLEQAEQVRRGVRGVTNMLRYIGALPGKPEQADRQLLLNNIKVMRPRAGGLCYPERSQVPGTIIEGRVKLGEIVSPYTFETLETIVAPFDKNVVVLSRNYTTRINPGDYMFMIGEFGTAKYF